jgi:predicted cupin superfamily sugar epimerase
MSTTDELIRHLNLRPHPKEGGHFCETYRSADMWPAAALPSRYGSDRRASTAIYYLLTKTTFSALHRLQSDEVFHFYLGSPVQMLQLWPDGTGRTVILGPDVLAGQQLQVVVPHGVWQGSLLAPGGDFALLGCTVAPGFEYADYETGRRDALLSRYPEFAELIGRLSVDA